MQKATTSSNTSNSAKKNTPVRYAFLYCNSPSTQRQYPKRLKIFFDFIGLEGEDLEQQGQSFLDQTRQDAEWANQRIMEYLDYNRQRVFKKEISPSTLKTLLQPIKTFCDAYDDIADSIKWKRIAKSMPRSKHFSSDRVPTLEELRKVIEYPDRRIKAVVYTMCSSGIRIGAWEYLRWKHIIPIVDNKTGEIQAAKIIIYAGEPEEHFSFITPEAYNALKAYMDFRALYGEKISGESWVIRNHFMTADVKRKSPVGGNYGKVTEPKAIEQKSLARLIIRAWNETGIRDILAEGGRGAVRRHEFKAAHGFRKYFKTRAEQVMNRLNVEYLLGHSIGLNSNYYRPTQQELQRDYLKAVPLLSINDQNVASLREQQEKLEQKQEEKDKQLEQMRQAMQRAAEQIAQLVADQRNQREQIEKATTVIDRLLLLKKEEEEIRRGEEELLKKKKQFRKTGT